MLNVTARFSLRLRLRVLLLPVPPNHRHCQTRRHSQSQLLGASGSSNCQWHWHWHARHSSCTGRPRRAPIMSSYFSPLQAQALQGRAHCQWQAADSDDSKSHCWRTQRVTAGGLKFKLFKFQFDSDSDTGTRNFHLQVSTRYPEYSLYLRLSGIRCRLTSQNKYRDLAGEPS